MRLDPSRNLYTPSQLLVKKPNHIYVRVKKAVTKMFTRVSLKQRIGSFSGDLV